LPLNVPGRLVRPSLTPILPRLARINSPHRGTSFSAGFRAPTESRTGSARNLHGRPRGLQQRQGGSRSGDNSSRPSSSRPRSPGVNSHIQMAPLPVARVLRFEEEDPPNLPPGEEGGAETQAHGPRWRNSRGRRWWQVPMPPPYVSVEQNRSERSARGRGESQSMCRTATK
jgi:hypothetical protein